MQYLDVVHRSFPIKLITVTIAIILAATALSAGLLHFSVSRDLGESYSERLSVLSLYKYEVIRQSLFVFIGFGLMAVLGIAVFGVLHTHKIVGPLVRTRAVARQIADGRFDVTVKFREGDMIPSVADSLNNFARIYSGRYELVRNGIHDLRADALAFRELVESGDLEGAAATRGRMVLKMQELNRLIAGIKL